MVRLVSLLTRFPARGLAGLLFAGLILSSVRAEDGFTHVRLLDRAESAAGWTESAVVQQLEIIRDLANAEPVSSDPVSDRYSITFFAGPIDWVHFLNLAIFVYSGDQNFGEAQLNQWISEGGPDFEAGRNQANPSAATPDDLPSNALGALFGRELAELGPAPNLRQQLLTFIAPLKPAPDSVAKRFSRHEAVLGLGKDPSRAELDHAFAWFTAEPLNLTPKLSEAMGLAPEPSGAAALRKAGFQLTRFQGKLVVIERLP